MRDHEYWRPPPSDDAGMIIAMRDDDFNRFMGGQSNAKHFSIIFLICILMVLLLVWSISVI